MAPKRKTDDDHVDAPAPQTPKDEKKPAKKPRTQQAWSQAEELALRRAMIKIALSNLADVRSEPGLEKRDTGKINMKLRGVAKHYEKEYNGDVSWIDNFVKYKRGGQ